MNLYARQGDLVIERLGDTTIEGAEKATDIVLAGDSSGHRHRIIGEVMRKVDGRVISVLLSKPTTMVHEKADGHKTINLEAGAYRIRPLRERGDASDRAVED